MNTAAVFHLHKLIVSNRKKTKLETTEPIHLFLVIFMLTLQDWKKKPEIIMADLKNQGHLKICIKDMKVKLLEILCQDPVTVKQVSVTGFDEACDEKFARLLSYFSHAESLHMEGNSLVTDHHLKIIGGRLKKLRSLVIAMNTSITDVGLGYLSGESLLSDEVSCPLLESLEIERAHCITNKGIYAITSRLLKLKHLILCINEAHKDTE